MKHTMIIYDRDRRYAYKAAGYINSKDGFPFEVRVPDSVDAVLHGTKGLNIDIALIDEELTEEVKAFTDAGTEVLLLSGDSLKKIGSRQVIYKYQNIEGMIKEILMYASTREKLGSLITRKNQMKLIGLFSPVRRSGQTGLGLAIGQILSKTHRTLFVSMDCYGPIPTDALNIPYSGDLSDLMYSMNNDVKDIAALIGGVSGSLGGLEVLPPMERHNDLISITFSQWRSFLRYLEEGTDYEYIILDMSAAVQGLVEITALCNKLIVTMIDEKTDSRRLESFKRELQGIENIEDNMRLIRVPCGKDSSGGYISAGNMEMTECARELIKEIVA